MTGACGKETRTIALWGYGRYGKRLYRAIREHWAQRYRVTAVFDASFGDTSQEADLASDGVLAENPSSMYDRYREGLFEGVVVAVARYDVASHVKDEIDRKGIPVMTLGSIDDFKFADAFDGCATLDDSADMHGYALRRYDGILGVYSALDDGRPTLYLFDEAGSIVRDTWFTNDLRYDQYTLNYPRPFADVPGKRVSLGGDYCIVGRMWGKNYWHFTFQHLDQIELMERRGYRGSYVLARPPFAVELLDLMGIDRERLIWIDSLNPDTVYSFEHAFVVARELYSKHEAAPVMLGVAERILANVECEDGTRDYPAKLYVKRAKTRRLLDCDEVIEKCGFKAIVPEELSVREQIRYFNKADIVLCPHGANSTNSVFMHQGAVFVETFNGSWIRPYCHEPLFLKGVHYLPIVDMPVYPRRTEGQYSDYSINPRLLEATLRSAECLATLP